MSTFHVGSDHGAVTLRAVVVETLKALGHAVASEEGPATAEDKTDYPDVAHVVARRVAEQPGSFGVLVCGTGQGMCISANKIAGIRAGVVMDPFSARMLRAHNDANVLCLGERVVGTELAKILVEEFAGAAFEGGRHEGRVSKIEPAAD